MKRPLYTLIRLLGCMTILLYLAGLFFGIFFPEKQDTLGFFVFTGFITGIIYVSLGFIFVS